jgi:phosphate transport system substrate-binding protein
LYKILLSILLTIFVFTTCKKEEIRLSGSETMHETMLFLANEFSKINSKYHFDVKGGGSLEGILQLKKSMTDIALVSRELTDEEKLELGNFEQIPIAYDGASIVVHPSNSIDGLDLLTLSDIFSGKILNWKELGGPDLPIQLIIRNSNSGTASFFESHVLHRKDLGFDFYDPTRKYGSQTIVAQDNSDLVQKVSSSTGSISYIGMGLAHAAEPKMKVLKYSRKSDEEKILPTIENVIQRKYKLARALYVIFNDKSYKKVEEFISYITSEQGQQAIQKKGYLRSTLPEVNVESNRK